MSLKNQKKVMLIILDGFGMRKEKSFNSIENASMPNWDYYKSTYAFGTIEASGERVGLPASQFGNSEVGHLNIGAGRIVRQDITRIDAAIENGEFFTNQVFIDAITASSTNTLHIIGLLSDGGVHCHINHIIALIQLTHKLGKKVLIHALLDGRDVPPQSALIYLKDLENLIAKYPDVKIATIGGRYYAMDRDKRYERIELGYKAIVLGESEIHRESAIDAVESSYRLGITDEFVKPTIIGDYSGFQSGDSVIFANFRADRAMQLTDAITNENFTHFKCLNSIKLAGFVTMTNYDPNFKVSVAYDKILLKNTLGEVIANHNLKQLRIAETEKYPHVTYFFSGGTKRLYLNEEQILINSPREVATYDLKPEMSLPEVTIKLMDAIKSEKYDLIVTNFANGDMVGHTGDFNAAIKSVEAIDIALGQIIPEMQKVGGEVIIIADHGNCEEMFDIKVNQPHTQHTTNVVPFLYIGRFATILPGGALEDVAPSILALMEIDKPVEMTGKNLIILN